MSDDQFIPEPSDWFSAEVRARGSYFVFFTLSNGEDVFANPKHVNMPRSHICMLSKGDKAALRMERNDKEAPPWKALEVQMQGTYKFPSEAELAEVLWWEADHHGMLKRECGCWIFASSREAISLTKGDWVRITEYVRNNRSVAVIATKLEQDDAGDHYDGQLSG